MLQYLLIPFVALVASALTLFSGFGLGTLLLPAIAVFFPVDLAVAITAVVHLLNNLFKLTLLGKRADKSVVLRFGIPAIVASFLGAMMLVWISELPPLLTYGTDQKYRITPVKITIAILMVIFALLELIPRQQKVSFDRKYLPLGGVISGFFGGLSGHQGALRSAFLMRVGLGKEAFIATGVVIACLIDLTRLAVYGKHFSAMGWKENGMLILLTTLCAFVGAFVGAMFLKKITFRSIRILISILLFALAALLASGVL